MHAHDDDHRAARHRTGHTRAGRAAGGHPLLGLQRDAGNHAVTRAVRESRADERRDTLFDVLASNGGSLDHDIRSRAEQGYGTGFGHVQVHKDPVAQRVTAAFGARALTVDSHILLGSSTVPDRDMFHELRHVYDQERGAVPGTDDGSGVAVSSPRDAFERRAVENGDQIDRGEAPDLSRPGSASPSVQRAPGVPAAVQRAGDDDEIRPAPLPAAPAQAPAPSAAVVPKPMTVSGAEVGARDKPEYWDGLKWEPDPSGRYSTAELPRDHPLFAKIQQYADDSQEHASYKAPKEENTRMVAATSARDEAAKAEAAARQKGDTAEEGRQATMRAAHEDRLREGERGGPAPPSSQYIEIDKIVVLANPDLWAKYSTSTSLWQQGRVRADASGNRTLTEDRSDSVHYTLPPHRRPDLGNEAKLEPTAELRELREGLAPAGLGPSTASSDGEAFLVHGSSPENLDRIQAGGFDPSKSKNKGTETNPRYGKIGQGTYLSDNFSKAQTYTNCPECGRYECKDPKHQARQMVLARVNLGDPEFARVGHLAGSLADRRRDYPKMTAEADSPGTAAGPPLTFSRRQENHQEGIPTGRTSLVSEKAPHGLGPTGSNEFAMKDAVSVYPEFRVYYRPTDKKKKE